MSRASRGALDASRWHRPCNASPPLGHPRQPCRARAVLTDIRASDVGGPRRDPTPREQTMERDLVFDIGVNSGEDTAQYLRRGFRVVGVDANPEMVALCEQRFRADISAGRLVLLNVGLAAEDGTASFFVSEGNRGVEGAPDPPLALRDKKASSPVLGC